MRGCEEEPSSNRIFEKRENKASTNEENLTLENSYKNPLSTKKMKYA